MNKFITLLLIILLNACVWHIPEGKYPPLKQNVTPPQHRTKLFARIIRQKGSLDIRHIQLQQLAKESNLFEIVAKPEQADYILEIVLKTPIYKNYCSICNVASIVTLGIIPTYTSTVYILESYLTDKKQNRLEKQTYYENVGELVSITSLPAYLWHNNIDTWDYQYRKINYDIINHILNDTAAKIYN